MNFRIKEKFILRISGGKGDIFQRRKLIEIRDLHNVLRTEKVLFQSSKKGRTKQSKTKNSRFDILFTMEYRLLVATEPSFWIFLGWKIRSFLSQNFDGNMIFTDIWKVLLLNFSGMGNTVFFWDKKLMERWHLLITQKFLLWTFWWWEIRSFFSQKVDAKIIFT